MQETSEVVERERLRPRSGHVPAGFVRRVFPIPRGQESNMAHTTDQLPKLAKVTELFTLNLSSDGKALVGIGQPRALDTAQGVLDLHMKRLPQFAQMAMQEQALKSKLKQTEEQKNYGSSVQFQVQHEHMGMVIGQNGNNIKKAQALPGVHLIEVRQDHTIIVFADKKEQVMRACKCASRRERKRARDTGVQ